MPLYDYECIDCGKEFECFFPLCDADKTPRCQCGSNNVNKVFRLGYGGVHGEHPQWMASTIDQIIPDGTRKPENRAELYRYMKKEGIAFRDKGSRGPAFI